MSNKQAVYVHRIERKGEATERDFHRASYELLRALCPDPRDQILIKPNVTIPTEPDSGIITHPGVKNLMGTITPMHLRHLCQQSFPPFRLIRFG